jgi:hypothetical protein
MPACNANNYSRRQADLRIQAEAEELMNEYGGVCAWIFRLRNPILDKKGGNGYKLTFFATLILLINRRSKVNFAL